MQFRQQSCFPTNPIVWLSLYNSLMHVLGYFKKVITKQEKKYFLDLLEEYNLKKIPLSALNSILYSWILRFDNQYLKNQSFFNPFPQDLIEANKSRFE